MEYFGWDKLLCGFFVKNCKAQFTDYMNSFDFIGCPEADSRGLVFQKEEIFVEISYGADDYPNYSITVLVGKSNSLVIEGWKANCLPLWFVIPNANEDEKYWQWTFSTERELIKALQLLRENLIGKYLMPLVDNTEFFIEKLKEFNQQGS